MATSTTRFNNIAPQIVLLLALAFTGQVIADEPPGGDEFNVPQPLDHLGAADSTHWCSGEADRSIYFIAWHRSR